MKAQTNNINEYHRIEIEEIFTRTREHRNQRAQITSFLGTAHLVILGLAFTNQKVGLLIVGASLLLALIITDYVLKRTLATLEFRGLQLEDMYAPNPDSALIHLLIAASYINSKQLDKLRAIAKIKDRDKQTAELRKPRFGLADSIFLPLLIIIELGMAISFWYAGWELF